MNIGQKIQKLKESMCFKDYQAMGKAIGFTGKEPGGWLLDLSKKDTIQTVDISKLMRVANYFNISLDWLLNDDSDIAITVGIDNLSDDDIGVQLKIISTNLSNGSNKFYGYSMKRETIKLAIDAIDEIQKIIKENL